MGVYGYAWNAGNEHVAASGDDEALRGGRRCNAGRPANANRPAGMIRLYGGGDRHLEGKRGTNTHARCSPSVTHFDCASKIVSTTSPFEVLAHQWAPLRGGGEW